MTGREQHLLALAWEAVNDDFPGWVYVVKRQDGLYQVEASGRQFLHRTPPKPTLAAAPEALLDDLGVEYPPEATAEQVREVADFLDLGVLRLSVLREAWRDHRPALDALLDEGGAR